MTKKIRVAGVDASLNHGGVALLVDGKLKDFAYYIDAAGAAARNKRGERLVMFESKPPDIQRKQMSRLAWVESFYLRTFARMKPDYVAIEDYALGAAHGSHYTGEIGGLLRMICWKAGYKFRLHDPLSLKMFVAHNGAAQKDQIEEAVKERWGVSFGALNPIPPKGKMVNRTVSTDMADAYSLAQMGWTEVQLRNGSVSMKDLHPQECRVFNRVTKMYPRSLLDREWICNAED